MCVCVCVCLCVCVCVCVCVWWKRSRKGKRKQKNIFGAKVLKQKKRNYFKLLISSKSEAIKPSLSSHTTFPPPTPSPPVFHSFFFFFSTHLLPWVNDTHCHNLGAFLTLWGDQAPTHDFIHANTTSHRKNITSVCFLSR